MNPDYNKQLEEAIHRELKKLPDLKAPETLASRVMAAMEQRAVPSWYRRPWQTWPTGLRIASFLLLVATIGALGFGGWKLSQAESVTLATQHFGSWISTADVIWHTLGALAGAFLLLLKQLNPILLTVCAAMAFLSYVICVGLATALFRFAFAKHQENHL